LSKKIGSAVLAVVEVVPTIVEVDVPPSPLGGLFEPDCEMWMPRNVNAAREAAMMVAMAASLCKGDKLSPQSLS
jgi:hypothetical protein